MESCGEPIEGGDAGAVEQQTGVRMMRRFAALVLVVELGLAMVGCSDLNHSPVGGAVSALILTDSGTETRYSLSVADGSLMLTETGSQGTAADPELIDSATGAHYSVAVTGGALTLVPGSSTTLGTLRIALADVVTAKNYALAVDNGALTLIPG